MVIGIGNMDRSKSLNSTDLINIGVFTAIMAVITLIVIPIGFLPVLMPLYCVFIPLFSGIPFMLFVTRVKKFGMITIMSILMALFLLCTGMGWYTLPLALITGFIADGLVKAGNYSSLKLSIAACSVFSLWCFGSYIPLIFMADQFWAENAQYGEEFINDSKDIFRLWMAPALIACCLVFGALGGVIGGRVLKKHFIRSGIL